MTPIDIRPADLETVRRILQEHAPTLEVHAFGSRVAWNARETSDLDLALMTDEPLSIDRTAALRSAFTESDLPFRVDIVDWATASENFRKRILAQHVVLGGRAVDVDSPTTAPLAAQDQQSVTDEWRATTLGKIVSLQRGFDLPTGERKRGPYLVIASTGPVGTHDRAMVRGPGVVVGRSGSLGGGQFIKRDFWPLNTTLWVKDFNANDPRFCYFLLKSLDLKRFNAGSGVPTLNRNHIHPLPVRVPPVSEQRTIGNILGALDDKIELNRRMNATLETMARALFRSWFVDFDPVRAKIEGRDTGLPKEVADLFPDRLVESELGEIPESWDVSEIGSEVKAVGGGTPSTKEPVYWNGGRHCWATPKDLSKLSSPALLGTDRKITDAGVGKISSGLLPRGTVLLSSRAPIGYLAIAEVPTAVNQGFIAMICQKRLPALYVLSWCHDNLERIKDVSGGSTFAEISKHAFRPLPVVVPPKTVLGVYDEASRSLHDRVVSNTRESRLLASLRDALLPKLVSGELRVNGREPPNGHDDLSTAVEAHGALTERRRDRCVRIPSRQAGIGNSDDVGASRAAVSRHHRRRTDS